jgi:hypothetical protein
MLIHETLPFPGAVLRIHVERAYDYDEKTGLWHYRQEEPDEIAHNLVTNAGRDQIHLQAYGTTGLATNGFNYIGLTNDSAAPAATDTALASELVVGSAAGLQRAQGVYAHSAGTNTTTITNTFTFTGGGSQAIQKTALFNLAGPPVAGIMNHEIAFSQRTLFTNDTITLTFTLTVG